MPGEQTLPQRPQLCLCPARYPRGPGNAAGPIGPSPPGGAAPAAVAAGDRSCPVAAAVGGDGQNGPGGISQVRLCGLQYPVQHSLVTLVMHVAPKDLHKHSPLPWSQNWEQHWSLAVQDSVRSRQLKQVWAEQLPAQQWLLSLHGTPSGRHEQVPLAGSQNPVQHWTFAVQEAGGLRQAPCSMQMELLQRWLRQQSKADVQLPPAKWQAGSAQTPFSQLRSLQQSKSSPQVPPVRRQQVGKTVKSCRQTVVPVPSSEHPLAAVHRPSSRVQSWHAPLTQFCDPVQVAHSPPPDPQAAGVVPGWQVAPSQQPAQLVVAQTHWPAVEHA